MAELPTSSYMCSSYKYVMYTNKLTRGKHSSDFYLQTIDFFYSFVSQIVYQVLVCMRVRVCTGDFVQFGQSIVFRFNNISQAPAAAEDVSHLNTATILL